MKQGLKLNLAHDQITGFSYSFTKALLEKLKELNKVEKLFEANGNFLPLGDSIITHLSDQVRIECPRFKGKDFEEFVQVIEEFLAIFEESQKSEIDKLLATPIEEIGIARTTVRALKLWPMIKTLGDVLDRTEEELLKGKNFNRTKMAGLKAFLEHHGLHLKLGS